MVGRVSDGVRTAVRTDKYTPAVRAVVGRVSDGVRTAVRTDSLYNISIVCCFCKNGAECESESIVGEYVNYPLRFREKCYQCNTRIRGASFFMSRFEKRFLFPVVPAQVHVTLDLVKLYQARLDCIVSEG